MAEALQSSYALRDVQVLATECPECGLALGAAANAAPDEKRSS